MCELSRSRTAPAHDVERAGIVLQPVAGPSASEIAMALRIDRLAAVVEPYAAAEMLRDMPAAERPAAILSYDEKPGIQAIGTAAQDLPPRPGRHPTLQRDHEYKRFGPVTLCAAADLVTVTVHHAVTERRRSREFVAFVRTSRLNRIETFFSKMARSVLRHIRVVSKAELTSRICRYIESAT